MGTCSICGEVKAYLRSDTYADGRPRILWICSVAHKARTVGSRERYQKSEKFRFVRFRHRYGLTKEQALAALALKGADCDICGAEVDLGYDHCHAAGHHRGWLCDPCNLGLGKFGDDPDRLRAAAAYLERPRSS